MRLKNFTLSVLFLFSFGFANAQCEVVNGSFEEWFETEFILPDGGNGEASGDVILPVGSIPFLRLLLLSFAAAFDPSVGLLLETEAQELSGISQSTDASEGDFALKLQAGYDVNIADIYSLNTCTVLPDQFNFDVKHVGETNDTLSVFIIFDEGLSPVPETEEDLANVPAYASTQMVFDSNSDYETISLPIIQNFEAPIDTFYYVINAETFDSSYFLIDNVNFDGGNSGCEVTAPTVTLTNEDPICICNNFDVTISLEYETELNINYNDLIIDDAGTIVSINNSGSSAHNELCYPTDELSSVVIAYEGIIEGLNEGENISDLTGCFDLSNVIDLDIYRLPKFGFNIFIDDLQQKEEIDICLQDDIFEVLSFSTDIAIENIAILLIDDFTEITMLRIDDLDETTTLMGIEPGSYTMGAVNYDVSFNLEVGQDVDDITFDGCFSVSDDVYEINVLGQDDNCVTDVEDIYTGNLSIRPNYSTGIFEINNPNNETYKLVVSDISGKVLVATNNSSTEHRIDLSNFPNGMYIASFQIEGFVHQEKIVKL